MSIVVILILISTTVAVIFLIAFIWAVKSGQYEDTDSPAVRVLLDDRKTKVGGSKKKKKTSK